MTRADWKRLCRVIVRNYRTGGRFTETATRLADLLDAGDHRAASRVWMEI